MKKDDCDFNYKKVIKILNSDLRMVCIIILCNSNQCTNAGTKITLHVVSDLQSVHTKKYHESKFL